MTHILAMVWHSIQVSPPPSIELDGEPEAIRVCCEAALTPTTTLTHILAMVWHRIQVSPPPSIELDGEPETIKEFAAKQH